MHQLPPYGTKDFLFAYGQAWSSADEELLTAVFSDDGVYHESAYENVYRGRVEVARFFRFMLAFSADTRIEYVACCGEPSNFAVEWLWTGTASGPILVDGMLHPPTHRRYAVPGMAWCRLNDRGEISYHRDFYDLRSLMRQIAA